MAMDPAAQFRVPCGTDKDELLKRYWDIPDRQIETSVVLGKRLKGLVRGGREKLKTERDNLFGRDIEAFEA